MSDFEEMQSLFEKLGINFEADDQYLHSPFIISKGMKRETKPCKAIILNCGIGYAGFATEFYFDQETGKFLTHGVWE